MAPETDSDSPGRDRRLRLQRKMSRAMSELSPQTSIIRPNYGGDFPFVGAPYVLRVHRGATPLQWLNSLTQRLFVLDSLVLTADGGFRRPGEEEPLFPMGNFNLKWRWDPNASKLVIDFWKDQKLLQWRWDELIPSNDLRFPSLVPDWSGTGHVSGSSFSYSMLSLVAENYYSKEKEAKKSSSTYKIVAAPGEAEGAVLPVVKRPPALTA
mmetsp:Transcript_32864/g.61614  ORF Transcript_32864/g.61614 Transcript_32864/m.61614 type:complete len:210 (-) Transcript_32864:157-786(-)